MRIETRALKKRYNGGHYALDGVDLTLESPSMVGLVGPNGAGKTTLMKMLVTQLLPSDGASGSMEQISSGRRKPSSGDSAISRRISGCTTS